ncbi:MAG: phospholipid/cholesterol/gamma-HCH transport system permease protein [Solirubrobacteraceae bacterium]|nr:phospholipid/cholesterol/gamma-HCH transport system permease protein [Solirubrobacteraceae bacterium]
MRFPRRDPLPPPRGALATVGEVGSFAVRLARDVPRTRRYGGEILRQAAIVASGSTLVICVIAFLAGGSCGLESSALARSFGTAPIAAGFSAWCTLREVVPFVFGYVLAAKVGCGLVAELGAMRVDEEVDALDAMSIRSLAYLGGTRLLGCALVLPAAYVLAIASAYGAAAMMSLGRFHDVSGGTWESFFLLFQDPTDLLFSGLKALAISAWVVTVSLSYGYGVRGGPVDVGVATARSMAVNIIGVTFISTAGTLLFWGANPRLPLG